jgi:hypothetical protein
LKVWSALISFVNGRLPHPYSRVTGGGPFELLAEEMVVKIFSFLSPVALARVGLVCRQWHLLSLEPSLWRTLPLHLLNNLSTNSVGAINLRVRRLAIMFPEVPTVEIVGQLLCHREPIFYLANYCKSVKHLVINPQYNTANGRYFSVDDAFRQLVRNNTASLRSIGIYDCEISSGQWSDLVGLSQLKRLKLNNCSIKQLSAWPISRSSSGSFSQLTHLSFQRIGDRGTLISNGNLVEVVKSCGPNMKDLKISTDAGSWIDDRIFALIGKNMTQLERLQLCTSVGEPGSVKFQTFSEMMKSCKQLRHLKLHFINGLFPLAQIFAVNNKKESNEEGTNESIDYLVQQLSKDFVKMEHLDIMCVNSVEMSGSDDLFFVELARRADQAKLKSLHINCPTVKMQTIGTLCVSLGSKLEKLDLEGMNEITDDQLESICDSCPRIKALRLASLPLLTNGAMKAIGRTLADLRVIDMNNCRSITQEGLVEVVNGCNQLGMILMIHQQPTQMMMKSLTELDQLQLLSLDVRAEQDLTSLVDCCRRLRYLVVADSSEVKGKVEERVVVMKSSVAGKVINRFWKDV